MPNIDATLGGIITTVIMIALNVIERFKHARASDIKDQVITDKTLEIDEARIKLAEREAALQSRKHDEAHEAAMLAIVSDVATEQGKVMVQVLTGLEKNTRVQDATAKALTSATEGLAALAEQVKRESSMNDARLSAMNAHVTKMTNEGKEHVTEAHTRTRELFGQQIASMNGRANE